MKRFVASALSALMLLAGVPAFAAPPLPFINTPVDTINAGLNAVTSNVNTAVTNINAQTGTYVVSAKSVNMNATSNTDTVVTIPVGVTKFAVSGFYITNCSTTPTSAKYALYTGAAETGTAVVANATFTGASSASAVVSFSIASTATITPGNLYFNLYTTNGAALTCDVYATLTNLS